MYNTDDALPDQKESGTERFETDTQKLMHRHLQDKDHVITEEDLKSIRVGMAPAAAEQRDLNEDGNKEPDKNTEPAGVPLTPWDAVESQGT